MLALNVEVTHALLRVMLATWGGKDVKVPDPLRVPRPGEKPQEPARYGDLVRRMASGR